MTLEERLQRLEDDRAIRDLKARYLRSADLKDPDGMAETLSPDVLIAYEGFPEFHDREAFIAIYRDLGCAPGIHDIHHAANGIISFDDADTASGRWSLLFHNINLAARTLTQFGVEYADRYVRHDGRWWITETRSWRKSCVIQTVDTAGHPQIIVMGDAPAQFGQTPTEQEG